MDSLSVDSVNVRKTEDGRYSIFDAIRFIAQKKNEHKVWKRLSDQHPEVVEWVSMHQFPGAGQKLTPVAKKEAIADIVGLLPDGKKRPTDNSGYVYLISAVGLPMVKIGKSINPQARLAAHQISSPVQLTLVKKAETQSMTDTERALKEFFKEFRSHGEWYRIGIDKACLIFSEAIEACRSFQEVALLATPEELEKMAKFNEFLLKELQSSDARGHSEISAVVQTAADKFQAMLEEFGVV